VLDIKNTSYSNHGYEETSLVVHVLTLSLNQAARSYYFFIIPTPRGGLFPWIK